MTHRLRLVALAVTALLCTGPAVWARSPGAYDPGNGDWRIAPEGVQPGLRTADGRACVKQCPNDTLPCDPPAYKQADGRCTTMWH